MKNKTEQKSDKSVTRLKHDTMWHFVSNYLYLLKGCGILNDKGFYRRYKSLEDYVNSKIDIPDGLEIIDEYVLVECKDISCADDNVK